MFSVLKQHSERMDIGYLDFRIFDVESITCLQIRLAINKEPILVLEIPYKLYNSHISGRLRHLIGLEPGSIACARFASCKVPGEKKTKPASVGP